MIITNAKDNLLNTSYGNLPNLQNPIIKWFLNIDFIRITKSIVDGEVSEVENLETFKGVIQNLDSKQLQIKPEAQRAWGWKMIHALPSLVLNVDDKIKYNDVKYRVMNIRDFREYGYIEYHIVEDYLTNE
jgi:hypothetical protein